MRYLRQHRTAQALYDAVVVRYSSPATAALGRLMLPYLFPELSAFATVEDLVTHLRTSDARYRAALGADFFDSNPPPMYITLYFIVTRLPDSLRAVRDHFLALDPTALNVDLLEQHLLAAETSVVAVGAARGTPRTPFFEGCSPSPLAPSYASAAAVVVLGAEDVGAASASGKCRSSKGKGGREGGGGSGGGGGDSSGGGGGSGGSGGGGSGGGGNNGGRAGATQRGGLGGGQRQHGSCLYVIRTGDRAGQTCGRPHTQHRCFSRLDGAWHAEFGDKGDRPRLAELLGCGVAIFDLDYDAILAAMYALTISAEGDCYLCVPPDLDIEATALGASESALPGTAPAEALHTFTLDSGACRCFFRDSTTLTPLSAPVPLRLADPSGPQFLPVPPPFSLVQRTDALPDAIVTTTSPGGQRVVICTCTWTSRHMATFTRRPGSSLYTLATKPPQVAASAQVFSSGPVAPPCSCRLLSHQNLLWHHRLGHPSLPRLRCMHSRLLVSGLPRSLPPLPPSPAPPCLPCIEGRQRAAPHSSSFPPTTAPLQTLHMDVWGPARVSGQADFYRGEGILQSFTLSDSLKKNGIAERHIGLVMEVDRTSMIDAAAPNFQWPFAVRYTAHHLNLWPRVSLPETSPTLHWTGEVGDVSVLRVWGSRAFVRDTSADKISARTILCVFLGFPPNAPSKQFYHPTSRRVFPSQDVMFDESVPFYCLFPYRSASPPPPPFFLVPGPPPVDPLPTQGPAPSGAARGAASGGAAFGGAEPGGTEPGGSESEGAGSGGAEPGGAEPVGVESGSAELEGVEPGGASPRLSTWPKPFSPQQLREWFTQLTRLRCGAAGAGDSPAGDTGARGARTRGTGAAKTGSVGGVGAGDPMEPRAAWAEGAGAGAGGAGGAGAGGAEFVGAGAGGTGVGGAGPGGAEAVDLGAGGARAEGAMSGGTGVGGTVQPRPYFVPLLQQVLGVPSATGLTPPLLCTLPYQSQPPLQQASSLPAPSPYTEQTGSLIERREPTSRLASPVRTGRRVPRQRPPPVPGTNAMVLRPSSVPLHVPLPLHPESSLPAIPDPESDRARAASPTVFRLLATVVTDPSFESTAASALVAELLDFAAACRLDYTIALVAESESSSPPFVGGECALGTDVLEGRKEDFECLAAFVPRFASMLLAPEGDPDAPDIPTPRSYAEAITVDGMWIFRVKRLLGSPPTFKSRYVARGFSQRQGVDYFQTFSPTPKMSTLRVLLHVATQRDYELHSLDFSTAFLQGSLHKEIWLRSPLGFTGSFPAGTQWSLRRPVYGLRQAPREWHDTLRTTLAAQGFTPSTADPSLFLRTDTSLRPFYVLVYIDDLVFATADTEALTLLKSELKKRHTCTDLGEIHSYLGLQITLDRARRTISLTQSHMVQQVLQRFGFQFSLPQPTPLSTSHLLSAPPSDESVEPSGPYLELVGCLMYLMTCTRPDLAYPLSLLARYVAPSRHRKVHWDAAKRVLRYLLEPIRHEADGATLSGSGSSGGSGGNGSGGSGAGVSQRGGSGGGQKQQQHRPSETPSPQQIRDSFALRGASGGSASCLYVIRMGDRAGQTCGKPHTQHRCFFRLDNAWRTEFGDEAERPRWAELLRSGVDIFALDYDAILAAMYALSVSVEGDCYLCVVPDPSIEAAALGASEFSLLGTTTAEVLHTFTLDSGAYRCFFRISTTLTPLPAPVLVRLADPSGGPVLDRSSTVLPCPAVPSGSLSGLHLPSFSMNLVSTAALYDAMVITTTPGGQRVSIGTCARTSCHLTTFTRRPGSSLYTLATEPPHVAASAQMSASGPVAPPCLCRLLSHQTLLWHHRLGHPSLPRLRGMHSRLLRAAPHSSSFPPMTTPLQTLHMDVWGPARVSGQGRERYFLLVVDDYTRYTTVFPLHSKGEVPDVLIPWIHAVHLQLRERFCQDLPVLRLDSNRGGEFSSDLLRDFCRGKGILQTFTLPASPQQNGIVEHKLSARAISCIFLGFPPDAPSWQFYHPTSRRVLPSQDVTFDESVPFYHLFPNRSAPLPPPLLFLAPGPPPVDPLPPQGPSPSGAARGAASRGAEPARTEPGGAEPEGAEPGGAESEGAGSGGTELGGAEPGGTEPAGAELGSAES
ncbi:unnamed protein product [Closterium sp. NIES-54]